jgi:hypothetical protein
LHSEEVWWASLKSLDKQINAEDNTNALLAEATHIINNFEDYLAEEEMYELAA